MKRVGYWRSALIRCLHYSPAADYPWPRPLRRQPPPKIGHRHNATSPKLILSRSLQLRQRRLSDKLVQPRRPAAGFPDLPPHRRTSKLHRWTIDAGRTTSMAHPCRSALTPSARNPSDQDQLSLNSIVFWPNEWSIDVVCSCAPDWIGQLRTRRACRTGGMPGRWELLAGVVALAARGVGRGRAQSRAHTIPGLPAIWRLICPSNATGLFRAHRLGPRHG
jgi:hypothetical protein